MKRTLQAAVVDKNLSCNHKVTIIDSQQTGRLRGMEVPRAALFSPTGILVCLCLFTILLTLLNQASSLFASMLSNLTQIPPMLLFQVIILLLIKVLYINRGPMIRFVKCQNNFLADSFV